MLKNILENQKFLRMYLIGIAMKGKMFCQFVYFPKPTSMSLMKVALSKIFDNKPKEEKLKTHKCVTVKKQKHYPKYMLSGSFRQILLVLLT